MVRAFVGAVLLVQALLLAPVVQAEELHPPRTFEIVRETSPSADESRYLITIKPGGTLWEVAATALPLVVLDQGGQAALGVVEEAFRSTFPGASTAAVRIGDRFALVVPSGTFVTRELADLGDRHLYVSFDGDRLEVFPPDSVLSYRLVRASEPGVALVRLQSGQHVDVLDVARRVFGEERPDFLQVRTIQEALQSRAVALRIDLQRRQLDELRRYRSRAVSREPGPEGRTIYRFHPNDVEVPFVVVEDGVGEEIDPSRFPHIVRIAYYRDGRVVKWVLTRPGDHLVTLQRPDNARWSSILPEWERWKPGRPEALEPFPPALDEHGNLLPERLLVLVFEPEAPKGSASATVECLGLPLAIVLVGATLASARRSAR